MKQVLTLLVLFPLLAAQAQEFLSLNRAIELALENDIRLLPGKTALQLAQIQQDTPAIWEDPEARVETGLNSGEDSVDSALRFYLPHPWKVRAASLERSSLTGEAVAVHQRTAATVVAEVYLMYRKFQCLEKEVALADRLAEMKQELFDQSDKQLEAGMATASQALLLRWELRKAMRDVRIFRGERDALKNRLAARIGVASDTLQIPAVELPDNVPVPDCREAIAQHPDLRLLQAQLQQAEAQVRLARAESVPWFNHVQTGYSDRSDEWDVQIALRIPVFSVRSSKKRIALAERSLRQVAVTVSMEAAAKRFHNALEAFQTAAVEWAVHRAGHDELTAVTQEEIQKLQEFAPSAPDVWLKLEERVIQAERDLLKTLEMVFFARADLLFAAGQTSIQE